jgi:hypothetical protein
MPSIEIVCIQQKAPLVYADTEFQIVTSNALESHRSSPLFADELASLSGCMYHLGNPDCYPNGLYFAYDLLSPASREFDDQTFFEINDLYRVQFRELLTALINASPVRSIFFYTDWQLGPEVTTRGGTLSESDFWRRHDEHLLKLNGCYTIKNV